MDIFFQQVVSGIATGGIYGSLALALVMIYQATDVVNFAQGEMAMFSTYLAWTLLNAGLPYWAAFLATLAIAFAGGLLIERTLIRPVETAPILAIVIVCIGLLVILNSLAGWIYSYIQKPFPSPFPAHPIRLGAIVFGAHDLGAIGVTLIVLAFLYVFFRYTPLGQGLPGLVGLDEEVLPRGKPRRPGQRLRLLGSSDARADPQAVRQRPQPREHHAAGRESQEPGAADAHPRHQDQHRRDGLRADRAGAAGPLRRRASVTFGEIYDAARLK